MKKQHLKLSEADESYLTEYLSRGQVQARILRRVTALLQLNQGLTIQAVADTLKVGHWTVSIWRNKYLTSGLVFLQDQPRSGRPVEIDGEQRAKVTALACSDTPDGRAKWSLRLLADKIVELEFCEEISHTQVGKILKKTNYSRI
jgi:putative transposase